MDQFNNIQYSFIAEPRNFVAMWIRSGAEDKERHEKVEPKAVDTPSPGPTVEAMNRCKGCRDREDVGQYVRMAVLIAEYLSMLVYGDFW